MPTIRTASGKEFESQWLPPQWEPIFCSKCGNRVGWCDTDYGDADQVLLCCDDCAAELKDDDCDDEEE